MEQDTVKAILALILMHAMNYMVEGCPSMCVCKWKNGKQTVECNFKNLMAIPEGMDAGTQVLEFNDNKLGALHTEKFLQMELINLQRIYLARCDIATIDDRTFKGLTNLVELDLSENLLGRVPSAVFVDCPSLMKLTLSSNPIKTIRRAAFSHLSFLNTLELSGCRIVNVEDAAFQGLNSLEWLRMDNNQLTALNGNKVLPDNLRGVELQGNPWQCDCRLRELHYWLESFSIPHSVEPLCTGPPKFKRRAVRSILSEELACLPDVEPTTFYLETAEGKNISLSCHVTAVPEAHVSWWFQGKQLQNDSLISPGLRLLYYIEDGTENKYSELFIYNTIAEDNGTFVCSAENAAGIVKTNYTIRVLVQKEPIVLVVTISFDYLLSAVIGAGTVAVVLFCAIIIMIVKCSRRRRRLQQKREKTKGVALQYQQNNSTKCAVIREEQNQLSTDYRGYCDVNPLSPQQQELHNQHILQQQQQQYHEQQQEQKIFYSAEDLLRAMSSPAEPANQLRSPTSLRRYQLEQNPDLINDTTERREADGEEISITGTSVATASIATTRQQQQQSDRIMQTSSAAVGTPLVTTIPFPVNYTTNNHRDGKLYPLHGWDVVGCSAVDVEGYPVDYGLPKLTANTVKQAYATENFYRTLPHKRIGTAAAATAGHAARRLSRDVEFLCLRATAAGAPSASYEHYCPDVRYTADGYPERAREPLSLTLLPSPPDAYKTGASITPLLGSSEAPWVLHHYPAHLHMFDSHHHNHQPSNASFSNVSKRCVGTDTREAEQGESCCTLPQKVDCSTTTVTTTESVSMLEVDNESANEIPTESPDEGYEGESAVL